MNFQKHFSYAHQMTIKVDWNVAFKKVYDDLNFRMIDGKNWCDYKFLEFLEKHSNSVQ